MKADKEKLALLLKGKRKRQNMSLRDVAEEISVSASTLCRIEHCTGICDLETIGRISRWLGVSTDEFLAQERLVPKSGSFMDDLAMLLSSQLRAEQADAVLKLVNVFRVSNGEI